MKPFVGFFKASGIAHGGNSQESPAGSGHAGPHAAHEASASFGVWWGKQALLC